MSVTLRALGAGFRSLVRSCGLVLLLLAVNLALALVLAVPFAGTLRDELSHTGASRTTLYGFDYDWWSRFDGHSRGVASTFAPDLTGTGFALRNLDLLLSGALPGGLFSGGVGTDGSVLGLGAVYWLLQVFLSGGLVSVFRASTGGWTFRGLVHACGFYFARLLRVGLLTLAVAALLFALYAPLVRWTEGLAREAVSERSALALHAGRVVLMLAGLAALHMLSSYAKVIVVCRERSSALLAFTEGAGFCLRNARAAAGQYLVVGVLGILLLGVFGWLDAHLWVTGWKSQLLALILIEGFVAARITLRLALLAGQVELYQGGAR